MRQAFRDRPYKARYPVLVNTDEGAQSLEIVCGGLAPDGKMYRYLFSDFDAIDRLIRKNKKIGIAMPLEGDSFRVVRFNLNGASRAVDTMRAAAERPSGERTPTRSRTTRDQVL